LNENIVDISSLIKPETFFQIFTYVSGRRN
jgi:hypothetical protein